MTQNGSVTKRLEGKIAVITGGILLLNGLSKKVPIFSSQVDAKAKLIMQ
jgi:hypothetical protein